MIKEMFSLRIFALLFTSIIFMISCSKDEDTTPEYEIPSTYSFDNVSYTGQTQRLSMMTELKRYMGTSISENGVLDATRLKAMFANDVTKAQFEGTYEDSKQIKSKTFEIVQNDFELLFDELAEVSQSTTEGLEGVSGRISSLDGAKTYLVGADGLDHAQVIEKGLMGACFYYQATAVYFGADKMNVDNEIVEAGEGTEMEHHWDEAFGYFGVEKNFPSSLDNLLFWGNYSNKRNEILGSNQKMIDALLKGRAAISNKDLDARNEAITTARKEWELIAVGSALHYLNSGINNFDDMSLRSHGLSEAIGFVFSLQFNPDKKITNSEVGEILTMIAGDDDFANMNLYNTTVERLQQAKDKLANDYDLNDKKDEF